MEKWFLYWPMPKVKYNNYRLGQAYISDWCPVHYAWFSCGGSHMPLGHGTSWLYTHLHSVSMLFTPPRASGPPWCTSQRPAPQCVTCICTVSGFSCIWASFRLTPNHSPSMVYWHFSKLYPTSWSSEVYPMLYSSDYLKGSMFSSKIKYLVDRMYNNYYGKGSLCMLVPCLGYVIFCNCKMS